LRAVRVERKLRAVLTLLAVFAPAAAGCRRDTPPPPPPTFHRDIAPIVYASCAPCHREGEAAPFTLLSYADVVRHADGVAMVTRRREMPPWLPARGEFPILGERRLRDDQIAAIQQWVKAGTPEGDPADAPKVPEWPGGWQLGKPDVVVPVARPYTLKPGEEDVYRNLVLPTALASDAFVRAVEFRTNGAPIHHAVVRVDRTPASRRRDGEDGQPGFDGMAWRGSQDPEGHFIGWAPGRGPIVAPEGMPWRLERGADLVVELHMLPPKSATPIQPSIGLYLSEAPPERTPLTVKMGSKLIDIPAGRRDYVVTDTYELPAPVELMSVYPHAHYLATDMLVTAALPDGAVRQLLHIPRWDFHWQQDYRYVTPIPLPAGTKVTMRYTYDNSEDNDDNPRDPPVRVRLGPQSTDEMAELGLQLMPRSTADAARIVQSFADRDALANVELGETRVRETPGNAEYRAFLGAAYLEVGRPADAVPHLEEAIRLDPRAAAAHNDLGTALMAQGRLGDALERFRRAAALAPRDETIQFNLGNALKNASRFTEAAAAYQRAIALNPAFADAHANMGALLFSRGRGREALPHFERAVALRPNSAVLHTNLAGALGAAGRYADALRHVRRALELNPEYGPARETLERLERIGIR
jgi:tetratricopeptide (TPR) repeat protein